MKDDDGPEFADMPGQRVTGNEIAFYNFYGFLNPGQSRSYASSEKRYLNSKL
jgi:hypothetical protein